MRVLFYNLAYCTGIDGSVSSLCRRGFKHLLPSHRKDLSVIDLMEQFLLAEQPDVCCFAEIDCDSPFVDRIRKHYPYSDVSHKYAEHGVLQRVPVIRRKGNAVFSRLPCSFHRHYFPRGGKRLLQEVAVQGGPSVFSSHFSVEGFARSSQIRFLSNLMRERSKQCIVCGDFNIFRGMKEIKPLTEGAGLVLANNPAHATFPSYKPRRVLDLFLHSPDVTVSKMRAPAMQMSDHLPIILDVVR